MYCSKCGTENDDKAKCCSKCGYKIKHSGISPIGADFLTNTTVCQECLLYVSKDAAFCSHCGAKLKLSTKHKIISFIVGIIAIIFMIIVSLMPFG